MQGILVSNDGDGRLLLDDGTGVIQISLSGDFRVRRWDTGVFPSLPSCFCGFSHFIMKLISGFYSGMYVMVVGGYFVGTGESPMIKVKLLIRKLLLLLFKKQAKNLSILRNAMAE